MGLPSISVATGGSTVCGAHYNDFVNNDLTNFNGGIKTGNVQTGGVTQRKSCETQ